MDTKDTAERILDAAERLFAERGIDQTSLREITSRAGANVAAVNYYFGSKEALAHEVFKRRMMPLNAERIRMLDSAEAAAGPEPAALEDVLRAFIAPTIEFMRLRPDSFRLFARFHIEPPEFREQCLSPEILGEVITRFRAAFLAALPGCPVNRIWWGVQYVLGAIIHVALSGEEIERLSGGEATEPGDQEKVEWLVEFAAAGLRDLGGER